VGAGANQPMYFDNLALIYDHYTVFKSRIRLQVIADVNFRASLYIDDDASAATSAQTAAEQPSAAMFRISPPTTFRPLMLTRSWDAKAYFGGDIFDNDNLQGTVSANPSEISVYTFQIAAADGTSTVAWTLAVEIEFDTVWDELKTQAAQ